MAVALGNATANVIQINGSGSITISSIIKNGTNVTTGNLSLTGAGAGSLTLGGANTFNGTYTANSGTTKLAVNNALGGVSAVSIATGATVFTSVLSTTNAINDAAAVTLNGNLDLSGGTETIGSLAGTATGAFLTIGKNTTTSGGITVGDTTSTSFAGVIQDGTATAGTTSFTKQGTGTLTLSNANTYSGTTAVNGGGSLLVNNTSGSGTGTSTVTVSNTGTLLGGTGTITGATTINSGAVISPGGTGGSSIGKLTTGALTINGTYTANLAGSASPAPGTTYDQISVVGALTLSATTSTLSVVTASTAGLALGQIRYIALNDGTDVIVGIFNGLIEGATVTDNLGDTFTISYLANGDAGTLGNDISLTVASFVPVPEPATVAAGLLALGALGWSQRRRVRGFLDARRRRSLLPVAA